MQTRLQYYWASKVKNKKVVNKWAKKWSACIWANWAYSNYNCKNQPMLYGPTGLNSFLWQFVFIILSVPRRAPRDVTGHLWTSRQICYDKYSDKYRRHNLVTNVQLSLRLMTTGSVSHRRGIMTHLLWPQPYRHCCVIEGVQWQEKDYNCHNQLVIEGLTSCSVRFSWRRGHPRNRSPAQNRKHRAKRIDGNGYVEVMCN